MNIKKKVKGNQSKAINQRQSIKGNRMQSKVTTRLKNLLVVVFTSLFQIRFHVITCSEAFLLGISVEIKIAHIVDSIVLENLVEVADFDLSRRISIWIFCIIDDSSVFSRKQTCEQWIFILKIIHFNTLCHLVFFQRSRTVCNV
jgi:hypothetical protein